MSRDSDRTPYERIGGQEAVQKLIGAFYQRVLGDGELRDFFADVPIDKLQTMQGAFFAAALGGPEPYTGRSLAEIHSGLGIQPRHVRRFLEHLLETLGGTDLDEDDRFDVYSRIAMRADEVTGIGSVDG